MMDMGACHRSVDKTFQKHGKYRKGVLWHFLDLSSCSSDIGLLLPFRFYQLYDTQISWMILDCYGIIILFRVQSASLLCTQHNAGPVILMWDKLDVLKNAYGYTS